MGYTNETTHYSIPLPLGSDKTTPMDYNESMQEVDTVLFEAKTDSASALQKANQLQQDLSTTNDNVTGVTGRVTTLEGTVRTQGEAITRHENEIRDVRQDVEDMIVAMELTQAQMNSSTETLTIGTYFRYNDVLYRVTQTISVGDTIVPNTNCVATNVGAELNQINASLAITHRTISTSNLHSSVTDIHVTETSSRNVHELKFDISISAALVRNSTLFKLVDADLPLEYTKVGTIDVLGAQDINIFIDSATANVKLATATTNATRLIGTFTYID